MGKTDIETEAAQLFWIWGKSYTQSFTTAITYTRLMK